MTPCLASMPASIDQPDCGRLHATSGRPPRPLILAGTARSTAGGCQEVTQEVIDPLESHVTYFGRHGRNFSASRSSRPVLLTEPRVRSWRLADGAWLGPVWKVSWRCVTPLGPLGSAG